ncbi:DUF4974 domain-containing protein [Sinomicrobium pectinilyticum]|uniref:DUF4974 domain-containing protein n=1 Tax=Sinomicrobium pectinilyticum TaxID=1084421 RepID=A0A3N0E3G5_SINP1|nr:FecR domain-containing protein [Sinomicrobium pectinilyticum]RNL82384.1 DUF4974 domain-containing protein [Sinomicrobium pectinilyticum]
MSGQKIENSIVRYLSGEATSEDLDILTDWIRIDNNLLIFTSYVELHYQTITAMNDPDTEKIKRVLLERMKKDKRGFSVHKIKPFLKYIAIGLLFFSMGYLLRQEIFGEKENRSLISEQKKVTIVLDDGTVKTVEPDNEGELVDSRGNIIGRQQKSKLTYSRSATYDKMIYHTLKVPYGKRFDLVLSDGTQVLLNSGTSLRYPVEFRKGSVRTVYLNGEAYFEVTEDKEHPFIVDANKVQVEVLGTEFNVSHYPEDPAINTVLVSGTVSLRATEEDGLKQEPVLLKPGYKGEWAKHRAKINVEKVNTEIYTSWTEGKLIFSNTPFLQIRRALERHYNVEIANNDAALDEQRFDAIFDVETIEQVLESFNKSYSIEYEIKDNRIIIN